MAAGENNCRVINYVNFLFPEILCRNTINYNKGEKMQVNIVFFGKIKIRRPVSVRFRLTNEYFFYHVIFRFRGFFHITNYTRQNLYSTTAQNYRFLLNKTTSPL